MDAGGKDPTLRDDRDDADLVTAARSGEPSAYGELVERWLDRCWEVAWRILHDRDLAADVAQDALLTGWQRLEGIEQPAAFGAWVLRISRNRALDVLARERRTMTTADEHVLDARPVGPGIAEPEAELYRDERQQLVWAAAAALGERDASLLDLHLRHGLEPGELADELGVSANAAHQALFRLRQRLGDAIRAWLLWRGGEPTCVELRSELAALGIERFGLEVARAIQLHLDDCAKCADERDRVTAPAALFSVGSARGDARHVARRAGGRAGACRRADQRRCATTHVRRRGPGGRRPQ
jgi:RNA polymerase sigma factor (sigma-70 family)